MRILVTGGDGFVGGAVCRALRARGDRVIAMDLRISDELAHETQEDEGMSAFAVDISEEDDVRRLLAETAPDAVIHCAAIVGVMASLRDRNQIFRVNIEGSVNLFEAMAEAGVRRVFHISSEEIYGHFARDRIDENHPHNPLFAYGITKSAVEHLGRSYKLTHGLECINLRTSWVYGPGLPRKRVPVNLLEGAICGAAVHVETGADSMIDHTYIDDLVSGVLAAVDCAEHPYDAYHIASDSCPSLAEIVTEIRDLIPGADISVGSGVYKHDGTVEIPRKGALDCSRARDVFGYSPRFDIRSGLRAHLEHLTTTSAKLETA